MDQVAGLWRRLKARLWPFLDMTAWVLLVVSLIPLIILDPSLVRVMAQWTAFILAFTAAAIIICRLAAPQIDLSVYVAEAKKGNVAAGIVVLAIAYLLVGILQAMVAWAKA